MLVHKIYNNIRHFIIYVMHVIGKLCDFNELFTACINGLKIPNVSYLVVSHNVLKLFFTNEWLISNICSVVSFC